MANTNLLFDSGRVFLTNSSTPADGYELGHVTDCSVDITTENKMFRGNQLYDFDGAITGASVSGSCTFSQITPQLWSALVGGAWSTGGRSVAVHRAPAAATVTVTNSATWLLDLSVTSGGVPFDRVASAPAVGQYSAAAGVYTFNAGQTGNVEIAYTYENASATSAVINNRSFDADVNRQFHLVLYSNRTNLQGTVETHVIEIPAAFITKVTESRKQKDYGSLSVEWTAMQDSAGCVMRRIS